MSNRSIPSDISAPELTRRAHSFLIKQSAELGPDALSAAATHLRAVAGENAAHLVSDAIAKAVHTIETERLSQADISEFARDAMKDYKGCVEKMEAVLQHTAVVDEYLGEGATKKLPDAVPSGVKNWLRRAWACIGPILKGCRSAGAVSVAIAQQVVDTVAVPDEPDAATLSQDTRLVVDEKAPQTAPTGQATQTHQEENTQEAPAENTTQTEPTHQASAEQ